MATLVHRCFVVGIGLLVMICIHPLVAQATVGWEIGGMVLDYGLDLEPGEERVLVDQEEVAILFLWNSPGNSTRTIADCTFRNPRVKGILGRRHS